MDIDDIFEKRHKNYKREYDDHYDGHEYYQSSQHDGRTTDFRYMLLNKLQGNMKLRKVFIAGSVILVLVIIVIVILLLPLAGKILGFAAENGVQGVLDAIWKGTK